MGSQDRASERFVRGLVERDKSVAESIGWIIGLLVIPTTLRATMDAGGLGLPFITYWPSLMLAAVLLRLRYAATFAFIAAVLSQRLFGGGAWFSELTPARFAFFGLFGFSAVVILMAGTFLRKLVRALAEVNAQQATFNRELRHRVRNMLSLIQALASRGPKATSPMDFYKEFSQRLDGLAAASDLLQIGAEAEGRLPQLARQTIAPFDQSTRIRLSGEPCTVPPNSCIPLIMALHELCTNAVRHGALSNAEGWVDLTWFIGADHTTLFVLWTERSGPLVDPRPERSGLGTKLLAPQPGLEGVELCFDPAGVWCEIRIEGAVQPAA
ncbi:MULTISPECIES: sensor histidine kinase [unclassified Novosphingobium]|uniref:sensor histidine kinase n=1 Tax=unclassified Novosphingobium TaxID=2644732 RepID=UPI0025D7F64E|nr:MULTISPECIES: sensor histidine kinase [unclassified Novosphingobium]HQS71445.1 sensor histidine kinase [Novosphingobium sp.]